MENITFRSYVLRILKDKICIWWGNHFIQGTSVWVGAFHCAIHLLVSVPSFPLWWKKVSAYHKIQYILMCDYWKNFWSWSNFIVAEVTKIGHSSHISSNPPSSDINNVHHHSTTYKTWKLTMYNTLNLW